MLKTAWLCVVVVLWAVTSQGSAPTDLSNIQWLELLRQDFESVNRSLGAYDLIIGLHGNVWTPLQWEQTASGIDQADWYVYNGNYNGQEVQIRCSFYPDTHTSTLHPVDRLGTLIIQFDQPVGLSSICSLSPWFDDFVARHALSVPKLFMFGGAACNTALSELDLVAGMDVAWFSSDAVIIPFSDAGKIVKIGFYDVFHVQSSPVDLASCFRAAKIRVPSCHKSGEHESGGEK